MIAKEMTIKEVLTKYPQVKEVLMGFGMHCFSCPCALAETLEEAAEVHEIDINLLMEKITEVIK